MIRCLTLFIKNLSLSLSLSLTARDNGRDHIGSTSIFFLRIFPLFLLLSSSFGFLVLSFLRNDRSIYVRSSPNLHILASPPALVKSLHIKRRVPKVVTSRRISPFEERRVSLYSDYLRYYYVSDSSSLA